MLFQSAPQLAIVTRLLQESGPRIGIDLRLSPLDDYSIADFGPKIKMANCTKIIEFSPLCLCILTGARATSPGNLYQAKND